VPNTAILLIDCPDRKGLVAAIANFLYEHNANILHADQHQDNQAGLFFMRVEWDLADFTLPLSRFRETFAPIAARLSMRWRLELSSVRPKVAIMVSKYDHCLEDLLYRRRSGELACDIPLIISNHPDARSLAAFHGVPYYYIPVTKEKKKEAEAEQLELLAQHGVDLVVLARYMQILSPEFVARYPERIINVHLPSCRPSAAPGPTTALTNAASSSSALPATSSRKCSTKDPLSPRTWRASPTGTRWKT